MQNLNMFVELQKGLTVNDGEHKVTETIDGNTRTKYKIKGIASTTSLDRDNEKVSPDCLKKMMLSLKTKKLPIFGNHEHSWENMLGYANEGTIQGDKLIIGFETAYEETHPKVKQLIGSLQSGLPLMLSIGGKVKMAKKDPTGKIGTIDEVDLLETSVVGIGANPDAFISLDQVAKAFKGDESMDTLEKELTPAPAHAEPNLSGATCPHCGKPINNPSSPNTPKIGEEPKLAIEGKSAEELNLKKGDLMVEEITKAAPEVNKAAEAEMEEKEYAKFKSRYQRMKAEGVNSTPGSENAQPKNSLKSTKEYEVMTKAFAENTAVEGIAKSTEPVETFSFKGFREEQIRRK